MLMMSRDITAFAGHGFISGQLCVISMPLATSLQSIPQRSHTMKRLPKVMLFIDDYSSRLFSLFRFDIFSPIIWLLLDFAFRDGRYVKATRFLPASQPPLHWVTSASRLPALGIINLIRKADDISYRAALRGWFIYFAWCSWCLSRAPILCTGRKQLSYRQPGGWRTAYKPFNATSPMYTGSASQAFTSPLHELKMGLPTLGFILLAELGVSALAGLCRRQYAYFYAFQDKYNTRNVKIWLS